MAYATQQDVADRWRELTPAEQTQATTLLEDAALLIDVAVGHPATTEVELAAATIVSVRMVKRAMQLDIIAGAQSVTESNGPFSTTLNYGQGNTGELYLTKADRALLGIGKQKVFTIELEGDRPTPPWWW